MPLTDPQLWQKIAKWPLPYRAERDELAEPPRDCTCFEHNLRKDGDWTDDSARLLTHAYRQFLYLKALTGASITPPKSIDSAWHLHQSFLRDYDAMTAHIGRPIPHLTHLTKAERWAAYDRGRSLYVTEFGADMAKTIWPTLEEVKRNRKFVLLAQVAGALFFVGIALGAFGFKLAASLICPTSFLVACVLALSGALSERTALETISRCG